LYGSGQQHVFFEKEAQNKSETYRITQRIYDDSLGKVLSEQI